MKEMSVSTLIPGIQSVALYHQSGEVLLQVNDMLTKVVHRQLLQSGIETVFVAETDKELRVFFLQRRFKKVSLQSMVGKRLETPLLGDKGIMLLPAGERVSSEIARQITYQSGTDVFCELPETETKLQQVKDFYKASGSPLIIGTLTAGFLTTAEKKSSATVKAHSSKDEDTEVRPRQHIRYDAGFPAQFRIRRSDVAAEEWVKENGEIINISRGGLMIACEIGILAEDDVLDLIFKGKDGEVTSCTVRVQRLFDVEGERQTAGLKFLGAAQGDV